MSTRSAAALALGLLGASAGSANAQCGAIVSQCRQCHEVEGARPVLEGGSPWHRDHAFGDFCPQCHGGDADTRDTARAHTGMMSPMTDVAVTCGPCHEPSRVAHAYSAPLQGPGNPTKGGGAPRAGAARAADSRIGNGLLAAAVLFFGAGGVAYVVRNERRLQAERSQPTEHVS